MELIMCNSFWFTRRNKMILNKVHITNFKGIEECTIELKKGFNLIIGNNGYGKTSILEAISVGLGGYIAGLEEMPTKHFTKDEIRVILEKQGEGSFNKRYMTPVSVKCEAVVEDECFEWVRRKNSLNASRSTVEPRAICKKAYQMANESEHILPILSYQSTARMWMQKREALEDIFSKKFYRTVGYAGCLQEASNIKMLMNWVRFMEKQEWKRKETIGEYYGVKKAVCRFMQCMMDEEVLSFEYDDQSDELIFVTRSNTLPVRYLSAGYQSLIWMIFDIAYRMALLNPALLERINETTGVVLIDELDMHLHPRWQWKVIEALQKTFPNVQFIAATHSPIIISSCKDVNIIKIDAYKKVAYDRSPYGMDINYALDSCQDSQMLPRDIQVLVNEFNKNIDELNLEAAEGNLYELRNILGDGHPRVTWAETTLELEKLPLGD